jgi:hypothetical protein
MEDDKEVYMHLRNLQQQVGEQSKVYQECLLKLVNCLQIKAINVFFTTIFITSLWMYLRLTILCMIRNTLIKHEDVEVICKENGLVITNYHALITHSKSKPIAQSIITYTTVKQ